LSEILRKIVVYQHSLPDGRAVELEELRQKEVLSPADFEFMRAHSVTYEPRRRNAFRGTTLSIPNESGCRVVGVSGRKAQKRTIPLRDFQAVVEDFLQLPPTDEGSWLLVHFSTYDGVSVDPKCIRFNFRDSQWQARIPAIRKVAVEHGLAPRLRNEANEPWHLSLAITSDAAHTAAVFVSLLRIGCGLDDRTEISYSAAALDMRDPGFSPDAPSADSVIRDKTHTFIHLCIQAALKRKGAERGHVDASAVLEVAAEVARKLFGADAPAVLRSNGINSSASLGEALYRMIQQGILSASDGDKVSDFSVRSSFDDLFDTH
jgi:uncharacterized repeat protein (TIGR04138 family)